MRIQAKCAKLEISNDWITKGEQIKATLSFDEGYLSMVLPGDFKINVGDTVEIALNEDVTGLKERIVTLETSRTLEEQIEAVRRAEREVP